MRGGSSGSRKCPPTIQVVVQGSKVTGSEFAGIQGCCTTLHPTKGEYFAILPHKNITQACQLRLGPSVSTTRATQSAAMREPSCMQDQTSERTSATKTLSRRDPANPNQTPYAQLPQLAIALTCNLHDPQLSRTPKVQRRCQGFYCLCGFQFGLGGGVWVSVFGFPPRRISEAHTNLLRLGICLYMAATLRPSVRRPSARKMQARA